MGNFDWRALAANVGDYQGRAQLHRPNEPRLVAQVVRTLRGQGLTTGDIGVALRASREAVEAIEREGA